MINKSEEKILKLIKQQEKYDTIINAVYDNPECIFLVSNFIDLTDTTIREFEDELNTIIGSKKQISIDFIREFKDKINWDHFSHELNINSKILKEFWDKVNWLNVIYNNDLNDDIIEFYITYVLEDRHYNESYIYPLISHQSISIKLLNKYWNIFKPFANSISKWQNLTEEFIEQHAEEVDWSEISSHQVLSEDFMKKWENKINWNFLHQTQGLSKQFVMEIYNEFMLNASHLVNYNMKFTQSFIERYYDVFKWDWTLISRYVNLNDKFIIKYKKKLHLDDIARFQKHLSEKFAEKYLIEYISLYIANHKVHTDFIREHVDKIEPLYWIDIINTQQWDENTIREFMPYINWNISYINIDWNFLREFNIDIIWRSKLVYIKLNEHNLEEFKDKLDWQRVCEYQTLSEKFIEKYSEKWNWNEVERYQKLSKNFIKKYEYRFK